MKKDHTPASQLDLMLIFIIFLLGCVSVLAITSAQTSLPENLRDINFAGKQITWYFLGFGAIAGAMIFDFDRFKLVAWYLYGLGIILLLGLELNFPASLVLEIKGAVSWYNIPGFGNFQPSEFMKIFLIIVLSQVIVKHNETYIEKTVREDFILLGKILLVSAVPLVLIVKQPDLGTTMVMAAIISSLVLVSGIRWRIIFGLVALVTVIASILIYIYFASPEFFTNYILKEYQLDRFKGWLNPHEYSSGLGFQLLKSLLAIGSGQLQGKGFMNSQVYFPEAHTDFIFSVIGEQFGFIGSSIVISLFFLLIYRMIHTALESHDPYGSLLCTGVIGMITFQVFQNIGMAIQLMPITGLPLPFISYGGSSLLTSMLGVGIVLNVRSRTRKYMFD